MNITKVYITLQEKGKQLAFASITLDNEFVIGGLKVLDGKNGLWVSMPNYKKADGEYQDICYPVTKEARQTIIDTVLAKFHEAQAKPSQSQPQREAESNIDFTILQEDPNELHKRGSGTPVIDILEDDLPFR